MNFRFLQSALLACALLVPCQVEAQTAREIRNQVEASMLVTGAVDIDGNGAVVSHSIDEREKLPAPVANLVDRAVPVMRFEPIMVDGRPVLARAKMSLLVVATPAGEGNMTIAIRSAHFGGGGSVPASPVRPAKLNMPRYPDSVAEMGGKGVVYLLLRVKRDGTVADVFTEQVNLTSVGNAQQMEIIRNRLSQATMRVARGWTFSLPEDALTGEREYWVVRVPVAFELPGDRAASYGEWSAYLPGPKRRPEWVQPDPPGFSPDALVTGGIHSGETKFRLLTPLEG